MLTDDLPIVNPSEKAINTRTIIFFKKNAPRKRVNAINLMVTIKLVKY